MSASRMLVSGIPPRVEMAEILVKSYVGLNETSKIEFDSTVLAANKSIVDRTRSNFFSHLITLLYLVSRKMAMRSGIVEHSATPGFSKV